MNTMLKTILMTIICFNVLADNIRVLKGYVNLNTKNKPFFVAADEEKRELSIIWPIKGFSDDEVDLMYDCMELKDTHVIMVDQVPDVQENVPTGIPGRTTTTHFPRFENVRCEKDPGFIRVWRLIVKSSKFR